MLVQHISSGRLGIVQSGRPCCSEALLPSSPVHAGAHAHQLQVAAYWILVYAHRAEQFLANFRDTPPHARLDVHTIWTSLSVQVNHSMRALGGTTSLQLVLGPYALSLLRCVCAEEGHTRGYFIEIGQRHALLEMSDCVTVGEKAVAFAAKATSYTSMRTPCMVRRNRPLSFSKGAALASGSSAISQQVLPPNMPCSTRTLILS